jgi:predicted signal transduction protein with EAL and GGDEF domain
LLEDVGSPADVEHAAKRLLEELAKPYDIAGRELVVSASIGVVLADTKYEKPEDLLRDADIAMYRAKGSGRARYQIFDVRMRERVRARFWMEAELRGAVERGEFGLLFQPIVDLKTSRLHAFEALVRWYHPDRGMILPAQFIPVAEETGLIVPIGAWALHAACREAQRWRRWLPGSVTIPVSVNLSARQLNDPGIVDEVRAALVDTGLDPACLQLEITESGLVENVEHSTELLRNLRALRVELLMDDFGTGYSSLGYLRRFPLQMLKIDRSFVRRMGARRTDLEILRSIVDLARNLGMGVVAEGVETEAQRRRLIAFGCRLGQGFHFARPLRAADLDPFLRTVGAGVPR